MNTTKMLAARAREMGASGLFDTECETLPPSPCVSVCRMTPDRSHCEGCFRTVDEIRAWSQADAGLRRTIWVRLLQRAGVTLEPVHGLGGQRVKVPSG